MKMKKHEIASKEVCIVCRKPKKGYPVEDDPVLMIIRGVKQRFGWAKGNRLVVCSEDLETARKKRARFEKYLMLYGLFAFALILVTFLTARSITGFFWGAAGAIFLMVLSIPIYYPKVDAPKGAEAAQPGKKGAAKGG